MEISENSQRFCKVILPLPLPKLYTYAIPGEMFEEAEIGKRVEVQFGKRKIYSAIIHTIDEIAPKDYVAKEILSVIDNFPIVYPVQIKFWEWMAAYYMCSLGEVMDAALPSALKLDSETAYCKHPYIDEPDKDLSDEEFLVAEAMKFQDELSYTDIQQITQKKYVGKIIKSLIDQHVIYPKESLVEKYAPKTQTFVILGEHLYKDKNALKQVFDEWKGAPKQLDLLLSFFDLSKGKQEVSKGELLKKADASPSSIDGLVKKGVFTLKIREIDRVGINDEATSKNKIVLNESQKVALQQVKEHFADKSVVLLHGVTSSGKTLLYNELIQEQVAKDKQVLFLVPEIALTAQLINRLQKLMGNVAVYHSKFNYAERVEIWKKVALGEIKVVLGPRSSMFLPFKSLGLVIVDEEHDASYKQQDPAPRYQGRDAAIVLAQMHDAKTILGSATPSLESYYNTRKQRYGLVQLTDRFGEGKLPELQFVNLTESRKRRELSSGFSSELRQAITETLAHRGQVILFHNRRGYAPYIACAACNWIPFCRHCDVSLTYHKFTNDLRCHYCGYRQSVPNQCKACGSQGMEQRSLGTERIEDDVKIIFPEARIIRMDYDSVKTKRGHEKIIDMLENREVDILVGTQMVMKGLDFGNVELVGVMNADNLLFYPDFRAAERAFQMLVQVSGRAGRRDFQGKVIIQMGNTAHPLVEFLKGNDFLPFYEKEMQERANYSYPPIFRLLNITLKDMDFKIVAEAADQMANELKTVLGDKVVGPNTPIIGKIQNQYIREIMIKTERQKETLQLTRTSVYTAIDNLMQLQKFRKVRVIIDVDPQ